MYQGITSLLGIALFLSLTPMNCWSSPELKIAAILPLSGKAASFGNAARNGIELALLEVQAMKPQVKFYDNKFQVKESVQAFRRAVATDKPDLVFSIGATHGNALAPIAESTHTYHFAASSDPKTSLDRKYTIRTWSSGEEEGGLLAREITTLTLTPIGIALSPNDYHFALRSGLVEQLPAQHIALDEEFQESQISDFVPFLLKAKRLQIKSLALFLDPGLAAILSKQAQTLNFFPKFLSGVQFESHSEVAAAEGALDGGIYVTRKSPAHFKEKYVKQYGSSDSLSLAALHYELTLKLSKIDRTLLPTLVLNLQKGKDQALSSQVSIARVAQ